MKPELKYELSLLTHFREAEARGERLPERSHYELPSFRAQHFDTRVASIENFVKRVAGKVAEINGTAEISTEKSYATVEGDMNVLTLRFDDQTFKVEDHRPGRFTSEAWMDYFNRTFLRSVSIAVPEFAQAVVQKFPELREDTEATLKRLNQRVLACPKENAARARRSEERAVWLSKRGLY